MAHIKKIARFLGKDNALSEEDYATVLERISLQSMRKDVKENPQSLELKFIVRKGETDGWRELMSEKHATWVDEMAFFKWAEKGSDIKYYADVLHKFKENNIGYHSLN